MALGFVIIGIMIYLALRFEWKFAVAAIVANLHDVIIILGFFAFFQWEFSLAVLAAVLAVLGYSVNESVVIFDRIRETFRRRRKMNTVEVIDHAITSTISRTIITHGSTQLMVLSMLIFGGPTLHYFSLALTVGILFGIYSSVFVAAAIAMWLGIKRETRQADEEGRASRSCRDAGRACGASPHPRLGPSTRLFHWLLVACIVGSLVSVNLGGNAVGWHFRSATQSWTAAVPPALGFAGPRYARFASFPPNPVAASRGCAVPAPRGRATIPSARSPVYAMLARSPAGRHRLFATDDIMWMGR